MREKLEMRKKIVSQWFGFLQSQIYEEFEKIERKKSKGKKNYFAKKVSWNKSENPNEGGQAPFEIFQKALKNNFEIYERVDTLACLKKK